jgi:hypothetical protein
MDSVFDVSKATVSAQDINPPEAMNDNNKNHKTSLTSHDSLSSMTFTITYTDTEEKWLMHQLKIFDTGYRHVSMPGHIIEELRNHFVHSIRLTQNFVPSCISATCEKFRNILKCQPEFTQLPDELQNQIWRKNYISAVTLFVVRMESCQNALEQLMYLVGELQKNNNWLQEYP